MSNEEEIRKQFKNEDDNINKKDLEEIKGFAANILKFIDEQDESTKSKINELFGSDKMNELRNITDK